MQRQDLVAHGNDKALQWDVLDFPELTSAKEIQYDIFKSLLTFPEILQ